MGKINFNSKSPFIIAEISANHGGDFDNCLKLIEIAKKTGANAVKFQSYSAESITLNSNKSDFLLPDASPWKVHMNLFQLYDYAKTPIEWFPELFKFARNIGILPLSSVFSEEEIDFLESLNIECYKIASPEINNVTLIKKVALTKKPIILSLGVASETDLKASIGMIRNYSENEIVVLQCDTSYPAPINNCNLALLNKLKSIDNIVIGYSDHTTSNLSAIVAAANGAKVFEKHLKLAYAPETPDSFFSASELEFETYVRDIHLAFDSLGEPKFRNSSESEVTYVSIYPIKSIKKGDSFTTDNVRIIRPGHGLHPKHWNKLTASIAKYNYEPGDRIMHEELN
jgi:N-acetylneuraminate synthase/pseudaminic acid synthase